MPCLVEPHRMEKWKGKQVCVKEAKNTGWSCLVATCSQSNWSSPVKPNPLLRNGQECPLRAGAIRPKFPLKVLTISQYYYIGTKSLHEFWWKQIVHKPMATHNSSRRYLWTVTATGLDSEWFMELTYVSLSIRMHGFFFFNFSSFIKIFSLIPVFLLCWYYSHSWHPTW